MHLQGDFFRISIKSIKVKLIRSCNDKQTRSYNYNEAILVYSHFSVLDIQLELVLDFSVYTPLIFYNFSLKCFKLLQF